jgi:hypothetical protein
MTCSTGLLAPIYCSLASQAADDLTSIKQVNSILASQKDFAIPMRVFSIEWRDAFIASGIGNGGCIQCVEQVFESSASASGGNVTSAILEQEQNA